MDMPEASRSQHFHDGHQDSSTFQHTSQSHQSYQDHYSRQPNPYDAEVAEDQHALGLDNNQQGRFTEEWDASQRGSSIIEGNHKLNPPDDRMQRSQSVNSYAVGDDHMLPVRGNTLKKKASIRRTGSLRRSSSRRSTRAGSVKSLALQSASDPDEAHSVFYCPVPTNGTPTDVLAERFQTWRKILKDLIAYFREIQSHYEQRAKALGKLSNVTNSIATPSSFLKTAGIDDALQLLRGYNKTAIMEANKAREIEEDVILALTGLRSDLQQKIKEIKHLSSDFKNSVEKEMDNTAKAVNALANILDKSEMDSSATTGKQDPFLLRLAVDRQVDRQLEEENYLHQAYLNLESSGRELESIVVGEIQKAYNAYAGILKRETDNALNVVGDLRDGPIAMPKDQEWIHFVTHEDRVVDPTMPLRSPDQIHYPGQDHFSAQEIRAGLLERKSKYLKSYTAGWYVLSTTHLHEFKSADKGQAPVMSLYLHEQKLGSHSEEGSSSNKFILKGRQTGGMHRGHNWVFRAESHDTMLAWYEDIKALTEKSPEERSHFVRTHSRSMSRSSRRSARSASSDGLDDEDEEPFSANEVDTNMMIKQDAALRRPQPGGRFPSDIQVTTQRGLHAPQSPSSLGSSGNQGYPSDTNVAAASGSGLSDQDRYTGEDRSYNGYGGTSHKPMGEVSSQAAIAQQVARYDGVNPYTSEPVNAENGDGLVPHHDNQHETAIPSGHSIPDNTHTDDSDAVANGNEYIGTEAEAGVPVELGLQSVPEAEVVDHATPLETPMTNDLPIRSNRPDNRTDSIQSVTNLDIPGKFPKSTTNVDQ